MAILLAATATTAKPAARINTYFISSNWTSIDHFNDETASKIRNNFYIDHQYRLILRAKNMKILITGGSGVVGTQLTSYLHEKGHEIHHLSRS